MTFLFLGRKGFILVCLYRHIMKKFTRVKKINGIPYLYEITPYYDPETKKNKQHSRYLGKLVEGKAVKVRSRLPRSTYSYGEFIPVIHVLREQRIEEILTKHMPEKDARALLILAQNHVVRPLALYHIQSWYEGTVLSRIYPGVHLSSRSLSKLLGRIGESDLPMEFSREIIRELGTSSTLVYDITSLSSYSKLIKLLEYGYNRDGLDLPQVNLSLVVDKDLGIPIMYTLYPGSVVDVSTLRNQLRMLRALGVRNSMLILDRGFFSTLNLEELCLSDMNFIIPASFSLKQVKELISGIHRELEDPNLMQMDELEAIFVKPVTLGIGGLKVKGYAYYNPKRELKEKELFYRKLHEVVEKLKKVRIRRWMNPKDIVAQIAGKFSPYIKWRRVDKQFELEIKKKAVAQRVNRMGRFVLLYQGELDWRECLATYRSKDIVEKGFDMLKNELKLLPLNAQRDSTLKGLLFGFFLAQMLRMRIMKIIQEKELVSKYNLEGMLLELEKIKKIELTDGEVLTSELTRKQREILDKMGLCA